MILVIYIIYCLIGLFMFCKIISNNVEILDYIGTLGIFVASLLIIPIWPLILSLLLIIKYNEETTPQVSKKAEEVHEASGIRRPKDNTNSVQSGSDYQIR